MKKDIIVPSTEGVSLALYPDKDADGKKIWVVGVLNQRGNPISNVIINASGKGRIKGVDKETANLRFLIQDVPAQSFKSFEILIKDALVLENTYRISFFDENTLCDKKIIIPPKYTSLHSKVLIPFVKKPGLIIS